MARVVDLGAQATGKRLSEIVRHAGCMEIVRTLRDDDSVTWSYMPELRGVCMVRDQELVVRSHTLQIVEDADMVAGTPTAPSEIGRNDPSGTRGNRTRAVAGRRRAQRTRSAESSLGCTLL